METSFHVPDWLRQNPPEKCSDAAISKPERKGVGWTKEGPDSYRHGDFSGLAKLQIPQLPIDLNEGINTFVPKDPNCHAGVEILIKAASTAGTPLETCSILTFRNNLNKIMGTLFDQNSSWMIDGCVLETSGPLFLDIYQKPEDPYVPGQSQPFVAWGYQFEAKCTGAEVADPNTEYGMLLSWKLSRPSTAGTAGESERLSIYMGAEIDAYDPELLSVLEKANKSDDPSSNLPPLSSLVELKTYPLPQHPGQFTTLYRFRHPKWWLQSYLAGVQNVLLGARDRNGVVREIHKLSTSDLPKISWQHKELWSPQQALAFGYDVLKWMKSVAVGQQTLGKHIRFEYKPYYNRIDFRVRESGDLIERINAALAAAKKRSLASTFG